MSGPPGAYRLPPSYLCYVLAEGPVYRSGQILPYILATLRTRSPESALEWLQGQARRVAGLLDPEPTRSRWVTPAMRMGRVPVPDAPTEMRVWSDDPDEARAARERLAHGVAVSVVVPDGPDRYTFAICPRPARRLLVAPVFPLRDQLRDRFLDQSPDQRKNR
ncbi:hypothetical protein ACFVIM_10535 [Streptomyces sp. NPDC057638]|uniref:hypothetical protein n=1 Tax=Streptomyces sp. NPDC057638 TaxID=3346190 RepID=UPI00368869CE